MKLGCYLLLASLALASASQDLVADLKNIQTPAQGLKFIENVKKVSSKEEQDVLKSLLVERQASSPKAVTLLGEVAKRAKGRRLTDDPALEYAHCPDFADNATCSGCAPCKWDDFWDRCEEPKCSDNKNEVDCCANAANIPTGCSWQAEVSGGQCNPKTCKDVTEGACGFLDNTCDKASTICGTLSGCQYGCDGCQDASAVCSEDATGVCSCGDADIGEALGAVFGAMSCPTMDCSSCLKDPDTMATPTLAEMEARRTSACSSDCDAIVHCESEVECLMGDGTSGDGSSGGATCATQTHTPEASCDATIVTTADPDAGTCVAGCADFDARCERRGKSCGAANTCASVTGADTATTQGMASCVKVLLLLASPLALGTKIY